MMFSVVIPVRDEGPRLQLTLAGLERQHGIEPAAYEVIVVDDDSSDDVAGVVASASARVPYALRMVSCSSGGARGVPRNRGAQEARGEFILFLDADALPGRKLLEVHRDAHAGSHQLVLGDIYVLSATEFLRDPADGTPFPGKEPEDPLILPLESVRLGMQDEELLAHAEKGGYPGHGPWHRQLEEVLAECAVPLSWMGAIPHNLCVPRETFYHLGGFDGSLSHLEGWDFGIRALHAGYAIGFAKGARSFHLFHQRERDRSYEETPDILAERYPNDHVYLLQLWFHACVGDPYIPRELNLMDWRVVRQMLTDPEQYLECRRLRRVWRRLRLPTPPLDYWLGTALNSSFCLQKFKER